MDKLFNALSLARRAGALVYGFEAVKKAVQDGSATQVYICRDTAQRTEKNVSSFAQPIALPRDMDDIKGIFPKAVAVLAVTDENINRLILKTIEEQSI